MPITFDSRISGIPCQIRVLWYRKGNHSRQAETPEEYYGDFEYEVLDRKGYIADWLRDKMTADDEGRFVDEYKEHLEYLMEP